MKHYCFVYSFESLVSTQTGFPPEGSPRLHYYRAYITDRYTYEKTIIYDDSDLAIELAHECIGYNFIYNTI